MRRAKASDRHCCKTANAAVVLDAHAIEHTERVGCRFEAETLHLHAANLLYGRCLVFSGGRNNVYPVDLAGDGGVVLRLNVLAHVFGLRSGCGFVRRKNGNRIQILKRGSVQTS